VHRCRGATKCAGASYKRVLTVCTELSGLPLRAIFKIQARSGGSYEQRATIRDISLGKAARSDSHVYTLMPKKLMIPILSPNVRTTLGVRVADKGGLPLREALLVGS